MCIQDCHHDPPLYQEVTRITVLHGEIDELDGYFEHISAYAEAVLEGSHCLIADGTLVLHITEPQGSPPLIREFLLKETRIWQTIHTREDEQ